MIKYLFFILVVFSYSNVGDILDRLEYEEDNLVEQMMAEVAPEATPIVYTPPPIISRADHLSESYYRLYLVIGILITSILFMWIVTRVISKSPDYKSSDLVTASGLILVVQGTLFVVIAAVSTEALTAAIGLLGGVGGYLFGKSKS